MDITTSNSSKSVPAKNNPNFEEEDVDDIIEKIVKAEDSDLVAELNTCSPDTETEIVNFPRKSLADFLVLYREHKFVVEEREEEDVLESILEDIINSTNNTGLVEIVDCY